MENRPRVEITTSRQFVDWMSEQDISLAFTTYQSGKLFLLGRQSGGRLSIFERTFNRAMGLHASGDSLYLGTLFQLWRLENVLPQDETHNGYDRVFVPQVAWTTGDVDIHDVATDASGRILFVNTLFSCLATTSERYSFQPLWTPPFITRLAAEDRCHLNGLALIDGEPRYLTAVSSADVVDGWRERRRDGGVLIDFTTSTVVVAGLSMPHSPRWYRGRVWLLDSGNGHFGFADTQSGKFHPVAFCPGYLRGLAFTGDYAVVGLSKARDPAAFAGLPLHAALAQHKAETRCAIHVIDLRTGDTVHWLRIEGSVEELYDVCILPRAHRPMAIGLVSDEIRRTISIAPHAAEAPPPAG